MRRLGYSSMTQKQNTNKVSNRRVQSHQDHKKCLRSNAQLTFRQNTDRQRKYSILKQGTSTSFLISLNSSIITKPYNDL